MSNFKAVIGLEIHTQLNLQNKMFSPEKFEFGVLQNTLTSEISLGYPGTLPTLNMTAIDYAIKLGLACHSDITEENYFARKNYFYPDLPKGYQITQDTTPICKNGFINFDVDGKEKTINITRIHIEEDAAKIQTTSKQSSFNKDKYSLHNENNEINIDFNRAGVALLEIVTEPDFNSGYEVFCFLHEFRRIVRYLNICNGNMEEGSMRCDANVSVMPVDSNVYGQRVEVKNMNSISNVQTAINYEISRQINEIKSGKEIQPETRMFDAETNTTKFQRIKETADDYKYFTEPDIKPVYVSQEKIDNIKSQMPLLPHEYKKKLISEYGLTKYQAEVLIEDRDLINFYEDLCGNNFKNYKIVANWLLGPIKGLINEFKLNIGDIFNLIPHIQELITMVFNNEVNYTVASQNILRHMFEHPNKKPKDIAMEFNFIQDCDVNFIEVVVDEVLLKYKNKVIEYKNGKNGLLGLFIGEVVKRTKGKANPKFINEILNKKLRF